MVFGIGFGRQIALGNNKNPRSPVSPYRQMFIRTENRRSAPSSQIQGDCATTAAATTITAV